MYYGLLNFQKIPDIGFAMAHYSENYRTTYGSRKKTVEVAYINSGTVKLTYSGCDMYAEEGSVIVLFREFPVSVATVGGGQHSHYTVLAEFEDYELTFWDNSRECAGAGLLLPFVTKPCANSEELGRRLRTIASDMAQSRDCKALETSLSFLEILHTLSDICRGTCNAKSEAYRRISDEVKRCVADNTDKKITLQFLAEQIGKSPNHISHAFKAHCGITVVEYINSQRVKKAAQLIKAHSLSFSEACEKAGIEDQTYGYRLFKKHMGLTPAQFARIQKLELNK